MVSQCWAKSEGEQSNCLKKNCICRCHGQRQREKQSEWEYEGLPLFRGAEVDDRGEWTATATASQPLSAYHPSRSPVEDNASVPSSPLT